MSNSMLEQAIIDASELREAALKSAETAVIEKYSAEVEQAMEKILEQEDELDLGMEDEMGAGEEEIELDIPMAYDPDVEGDDVVVVDLDQIIAAADAEEDPEEESFELDRQDLADEIGLDTSIEDSVSEPGNRDDEIELDESELVDIFKEILTVDIPKEDQEMVEEYDEETVPEEEAEAGVYVASPAADGVSKEDLESLEYKADRLEMKNEELTKENKQLKNLMKKVKNRLEEVNLSNARLLYTNRVLQDSSLNEQQNPQSLSEVVSRKSSVILSGRRESETSDGKSNPVLKRWSTLAGIYNK